MFHSPLQLSSQAPSVILASSSPRRKDILTQLHIAHTCISPNVDETSDIINPAERVCHLSEKKACAIEYSFIKKNLHAHPDATDAIIIGADTIVALSPQHTNSAFHNEYTILEKPSSAQEATEMLTLLSNKTHEVYTGISIRYISLIHNIDTIETAYDIAHVYFIDIPSSLLATYINSHEWQGVAGAYRIQGLGALFVSSIQGNYSTVMGLSIPLLYAMIEKYKIF